MRLGFNTNGLAFHRPDDALTLLAEQGYDSVGITVDHQWLDPYAAELERSAERLHLRLEKLKLSCVIETGARFLLDPRLKHEPTLVSPLAADRLRRVDFLKRCIDLAVRLQSPLVSIWSGVLHDDASEAEAWRRLRDGLLETADHAANRGVLLAFEPEPGMFVERMSQLARLVDLVRHPALRLTLDVGHIHCLDDGSIADRIREWSRMLANVHIEDMRRGVHEHLRFGEGEIDFPPVLQALREVGYEGVLFVELSRHSHMAPTVVAESKQFLDRMLGDLDRT